jgi:hypothetical protein
MRLRALEIADLFSPTVPTNMTRRRLRLVFVTCLDQRQHRRKPAWIVAAGCGDDPSGRQLNSQNGEWTTIGLRGDAPYLYPFPRDYTAARNPFAKHSSKPSTNLQPRFYAPSTRKH